MSVEAPESVTLTPVGATSFDVSWVRPGGAHLDIEISYSFAVFVREAEDTKAQFTMVYQTKAEDGDELEYRMHDLKEGMAYEVYVQSFGIMGPGDESKKTKITMPMGAPCHPPQQLVVIDNTTTGFTLQWSPPALHNDGGPDPTIKGYKLFYDLEGSGDEFVEVEIPADTCSTKIEGLSPNGVYRIQVLAYNDAADGPESPILRFKLGESRESPVKSPEDGTFESISNRDATLPRAPKKGTDIASRKLEAGVGTLYTAPEALKEADDHFTQAADKLPVGRVTQALAALAVAPAATHSEPRAGPTITVADVLADSSSDATLPRQPRRSKDFHFGVKPQPTLYPGATDETETDTFVEREPLQVQMRPRGSRHRPRSSIERNSFMLVSRSKSIRGKKNAVRKTKERFVALKEEAEKEADATHRSIQEERDLGQVVLYTTSLSTIRQTYSDCQSLMKILYNRRIKVHVKDISMDKAYATELSERAGAGTPVPQLFVKGEPLGGHTDVFKMNERGELVLALEGCEQRPMEDCPCCAGTGFMLCTWCGGSMQSTPVSSKFEKDHRKTALKCTVCNENGLERCREC